MNDMEKGNLFPFFYAHKIMEVRLAPPWVRYPIKESSRHKKSTTRVLLTEVVAREGSQEIHFREL